MFWQSVADGLLAIFNWRIVVGAFSVAAVSIAVPLAAGLTAGNSDSGARTGAGCLMLMIGGPIAQACAITLFVLFCLPSLIGTGGFTPLSLAGAIWWPVLKSGLLAMVFVLILSVIPIVGHFVAHTPGVPLFLQGIFVMKPLTMEIYAAATDSRLADEAFPGFWACTGYIVIGIVVCYAVFIIVGLAEAEMRKRRDPIGHMMSQYSSSSEPTPLLMLLGLAIGPIFGIFPLLMYGRYVAAFIRAS
jgi:hypothetical protein